MTKNMCNTKEKISRENSVIRTRRYLKLRIKKIFQPVVDTHTENRFFGFNTPVQYKYLISNQFVRPEEKIVARIYLIYHHDTACIYQKN